jgi:GNAT superfamily N-acetyltransferase
VVHARFTRADLQRGDPSSKALLTLLEEIMGWPIALQTGRLAHCAGLQVGFVEPMGIAAPITITRTNGSLVRLSPVTEHDREPLQQGLARLSVDARYTRFFHPIREFSEADLRYYTEVDQFNHVAWCAMDPHSLDFPGLGIGRFVRLKEDPLTAEVAVTVLDSHQRKGVGMLLMALLYFQALAGGVQTLQGTVHPTNRFLIGWLRNLGVSAKYDQGALVVKAPVTHDLSQLPAHPSAHRFRQVLEQVRTALEA